jgi:hypothetical protein
MKERTFAALCSILALVIVLAMGFLHVKTPHNIPFFVIFLVLMPILLVPMKAVNNRLLAKRKWRGKV